MILDYFEGNLSPEEWEELCDSCYRLRYQADNYQKIPSSHRGDGGIEGYTKNGIVYQSYCPEKEYTDTELYEHLRDKVTKDINKLLDNDHMKVLKDIGVSYIREWHFVTPEYRDKRILEHLNKKKNEVLGIKRRESKKYTYIDDNFDTVIKVAEDFKEEISRTIILSKGKIKINLTVLNDDQIDFNLCESEKISNIARKIKAVVSPNISDKINNIVNIYTRFYLRGVELLSNMKTNFPEQFKELFELINTSGNDALAQTLMSAGEDYKIKRVLFDNIMNDFANNLKNLNYLHESTIIELKNDIVAAWLADCSMEFKTDE